MCMPRFRLRTLMAAVAVVGVAVGVWVATSRWPARRERHKVMTQAHRRAQLVAHGRWGRIDDTYALTKPNPSLATYHARMVAKYRHAARYPWLPVGPDPPEPQP